MRRTSHQELFSEVNLTRHRPPGLRKNHIRKRKPLVLITLSVSSRFNHLHCWKGFADNFYQSAKNVIIHLCVNALCYKINVTSSDVHTIVEIHSRGSELVLRLVVS